jgi:hypothetical protein
MSPLLGLVQAGRAWHESIMEDACVITREGGRVLNETTGQYTVAETTIYPDPASGKTSGPCRLVVQPRQPQDASAVGQVEAVTHARCDLPVIASAAVKDGDVVTFTTSVDPALVGAKYRLRGLAGQTHATARRFFVEAYT